MSDTNKTSNDPNQELAIQASIPVAFAGPAFSPRPLTLSGVSIRVRRLQPEQIQAMQVHLKNGGIDSLQSYEDAIVSGGATDPKKLLALKVVQIATVGTDNNRLIFAGEPGLASLGALDKAEVVQIGKEVISFNGLV